MPTVSILVPVYKAEKTLDACVESILAQSYADFELLLIDDASPDHCPEMCDAWAKSDRRVRVIHRKNGGLSAARNTGIETARGRYIVFVDSDDFLEPDTIRRAVAEQERTGAELVIFNLVYANDRGERWPTPDFTIFQDEILDEDGVWARYFALENQKIYYTVAWNKLYTAKLFADGLRFPEGKRYEDQFFMLDVLRRCQTVACLGYQGYRYVQHSGSTMAVAGVAPQLPGTPRVSAGMESLFCRERQLPPGRGPFERRHREPVPEGKLRPVHPVAAGAVS